MPDEANSELAEDVMLLPNGEVETVEDVELDKITFDPQNVNKHPRRNIDRIKASLRRFGQLYPIELDPQNVLVAGEGRVIAARELGWKSIKATRCYLEGADRIAYALVNNRSQELSEWDYPALGQQLRQLADADFPVRDVVGFEQSEIDALFDSDGEWGDLQGEPAQAEQGRTKKKGGGPYREKVVLAVIDAGIKPDVMTALAELVIARGWRGQVTTSSMVCNACGNSMRQVQREEATT